jgi:hypothetical protein
MKIEDNNVGLYLQQLGEMSWEKLELLWSQGKEMKELMVQKQNDEQKKQEMQIMLWSTDRLTKHRKIYLEMKQAQILWKIEAIEQVNVENEGNNVALYL